MAIALAFAAHDITNLYVEQQNKLQCDNKELFCKQVKRIKQSRLHPQEEYSWLKRKR